MQTLISSSLRTKWNILLKWVIGALIIMVIAAMNVWDLPSYLSFASLMREREQLLAWTHDHYVLTVLLFIGFSCLTTALLIPIDIVVALAGGYLFGSVLGTAYVVVGATGGAILSFLSARYWFHDSVQSRFGARFPIIQQSVSRNGFGYLVALRLIPFVPFTAINLLAGLTPLKLGTFVGGTILGILPCSFLLVYSGSHLASLTSMRDVVSSSMALALSALGFLAFLAMALQQHVLNRSSATTLALSSSQLCSRFISSTTTNTGKTRNL